MAVTKANDTAWKTMRCSSSSSPRIQRMKVHTRKAEGGTAISPTATRTAPVGSIRFRISDESTTPPAESAAAKYGCTYHGIGTLQKDASDMAELQRGTDRRR